MQCRHTRELVFVSERDGNMELYKGPLEQDGRLNKQGLQRLTYSPALQAWRPLLLRV